MIWFSRHTCTLSIPWANQDIYAFPEQGTLIYSEGNVWDTVDDSSSPDLNIIKKKLDFFIQKHDPKQSKGDPKENLGPISRHCSEFSTVQ